MCGDGQKLLEGLGAALATQVLKRISAAPWVDSTNVAPLPSVLSPVSD